jgi:hypothetical protein
MRVFLSLLMLVSIIGCSKTPDRMPAQYKYTDEELVSAGIPLTSIKRELTSIAKKSDVIRKIDYIEMDPTTRIISVKGTVHYPLEKLFNFGIPMPGAAPANHDFELAISFPSAKRLYPTRYLTITFHRFRIDGDDYLNAFSIVASFVQTVMANSDLVNYVFDQAGSSIKDPSTMAMMREVIEDNGFMVNQTMKNIKLKLNLSYFKDLEPYKEIKDLRLWYLGPDLLGGTKSYKTFKVIAGIGKPTKSWLKRHQASLNRDNKTLEQVKSEYYQEYSDVKNATNVLNSYLDRLLSSEGITYSRLGANYQREVKSLKHSMDARARKALTRDNELFEADPEHEYINFIESQKDRVKTFITDLDRRLTIDRILRNGGDPSNKSKPIVTKRIGQDALNAGMNFVRDIEVDGQYYVKDAHLILAPHIPGMIMRGKINVDLNYLLGMMNTGFLKKKVNSKVVETTEGLPFEIVLETKFGDHSWLGLEPKSISLFSGERKLYFDRTSKNHRFFMDFIKVYIAQTVAAMNFDLTESTEDPELKHQRKLKEIYRYLELIKREYSDSSAGNIYQALINSMQFDVQKNPFASSGEKYIKKKGQILFGNLVKYDPSDKLLKLKLDPAIALDNIMGADNTLQVWNLEPITSSALNNTYLEIAVGDNKRGRDYLEEIYDRRNDLDNAGFAGLYQDNERSEADLLASINFGYLESYVNNLFQNVIKIKNGDYKREMAQDKEQTHYILDNLKLEVLPSQKLSLNLKASVLSKKKRGAIRRFFGADTWAEDRKSYGITAQIQLHQRDLKQIASQLRDHPQKIYFNNEAIGVTLNRIRVDFGKQSLVNRALSKLTNLNLDTPIGNKFRQLVLFIVQKYFNGKYKDKKGEKKLVGDALEEMARVLTTKKEIILLLNPRLSGPAFELKLVSGDDGFLKDGLKIDNRRKELHLAFTASTAMAKIDKREMINLIADTEKLVGKYLEIRSGKTLYKTMNKDLAVDKIVRASDEGKMSLYNRLINVLRHYDQVVNVANIPYRAKNADKRITSCGVELMYFAGASFALYNQLWKLTEHIKKKKVDKKVRYFSALMEARNKLYNNIMTPLYDKYKSTGRHHLNQSIIDAKPSYWNYNFYPDAYFANAIYGELNKMLK